MIRANKIKQNPIILAGKKKKLKKDSVLITISTTYCIIVKT